MTEASAYTRTEVGLHQPECTRNGAETTFLPPHYPIWSGEGVLDNICSNRVASRHNIMPTLLPATSIKMDDDSPNPHGFGREPTRRTQSYDSLDRRTRSSRSGAGSRLQSTRESSSQRNDDDDDAMDGSVLRSSPQDPGPDQTRPQKTTKDWTSGYSCLIFQSKDQLQPHKIDQFRLVVTSCL
jgi:hypothetical protein